MRDKKSFQKERKNPKVSIVITAWNVEPYIREAMVSALNQTYKNTEVIVVLDGGSTDETPKIVTKLENRYGFSVIRNPSNYGAGASRDAGIKQSNGEFILLLDGDDYIDETFVQSLVSRAIETKADIVSGGITICYEDSDKYESKTFGTKESEGIQKLLDYKNGDIIFLNNKLVRRSLYDKVPYCTRRFCEDTPVIVPMLYFANKVAYANHAGYYYRQRASSLCRATPQFEQALMKARCIIDLIEFFSDKGDEYSSLISLDEFTQHVLTLRELGKPEVMRVGDYKELSTVLMFFIQHMIETGQRTCA